MKKLISLSYLIVYLFIIACDGGGDSMIDSSNPDAVSLSLKMEGATRYSGSPPAPSNELAAPVLYNYSKDFTVGAGGNAGIELYAFDYIISGVYLQVIGADSYWDIPVGSLNGTKVSPDHQSQSRALATKEDYALILPIPSKLSEGEFCVEYSVYDANGLVSNVVSLCIKVVEPGGKNSEFLIGEWSGLKYVQKQNGVIEESIIGETYANDFTLQAYCYDAYVDLEINESYTENYLHLNISKDGGLTLENERNITSLDYTNSTCDELVYVNNQRVDDAGGVWTFDAETNEFVMALEVTYYYEGVESLDNQAIRGEMIVEDGVLIFTQYSILDRESYYSIHFKKK
ncbi:hypothetical protein [Reichenbachiella ulvae]|uniref:DUF1735 domain-containing protein n=1 Tax=Reichenbachiella ulvae TaxID=2980104 RepID=A0ABT3CPU6_9BACT|nr:hypothetical protein [Reichenbachiella ulvae]MCV9385568.1 hypothetical protein [Reichenbachiella ulvae]